MIRTGMILSVVLVVAVTAGCVPKEQYDKAMAAVQRANDELSKCQAALENLREENRNLRGDVGQRQQDLAGKDKLLSSLKEENDFLNAKLLELREMYEKALRQRVPPPGPVSFVPAKVDQALRGLADQNSDLIEYLPNYGMVKLKADPTFDLGSTDVKPKAVAALKKLAQILATEDAKNLHVYVAGHTDDIPLVKPQTIRDHGTNWGLGAHRALAVVKVLFEAGLEQRRMAAISFGKHHPVVANRPGNKGHPLNRRVEIWIVPPDRFLTVGGSVQPEKGGPPEEPVGVGLQK